MSSFRVTIAVAAVFFTGVLVTRGANWTNNVGGFWQDAFNWDHRPSNLEVTRITNAASKVVTIDATTVATAPGTMTNSAFKLWAPPGATTTNTVSMLNAGTSSPLDVLTSCTISNGGLLTITNSALVIDPTTGTDLTILGGGISMDSGTISAGTVTCFVGQVTSGQLTVRGGSVAANAMRVGDLPGSQGTLTVAGGVVNVAAGLRLGNDAGATGTVWVTGSGQLVLTNQPVGARIGDNGVGQMIVSNGTVLAGDFRVANGDSSILPPPAAVGTFTMAGGVMNVSSNFHIGRFTNSVGTVWITGGQLTVTNPLNSIYVGTEGAGRMTVSNGLVFATSMVIGRTNGALGSVTMAGGLLTISAPGSAGVLEARRGTFAANAGTTTTDNLVATNAAGQFSISGGWISSGNTAVTNGQLFVIGDGVKAGTFHLLGGMHSFANNVRVRTNGVLSGCGTISGNVQVEGTVLADCGGTLTFTGIVTNNGTMRAVNGSVIESYGPVVNNGVIDIINGGTTSFHSSFINNGTVLYASSVRISQEAISGNDVLIRVPSVIGHSYQLQIGTSLTPTNWTTSGASQPGTGGVLTFPDAGGATNKPSRFYRLQVTAP